MAGEWVTRRIGALGRVVTGKTPPTVDADNFGGIYPFITIPDLDGRVFIDRTARTLSDCGANVMKSCLLPSGAVMMSCIATVGRCGITVRPSFTNQQINSVIPAEEVDPRFLYYVFTQLGHELESAGGGGSVYTNVSKSRFSDIEISLPLDIQQQRAIGHILGTLDDKIELNRRMNDTLEAMARAIFKDWFVDFGPVRAKSQGRDPGLPSGFAALFPDALDDDDKPVGWQLVPLTECASLNPESWSKVNPPDEIEYVDLANTKWGVIEATQRLLWQDAPSRAQRILRPGDTIVGTVRPGNGSYSFIRVGGLTGSTGFAVLRPKHTRHQEFVYLAATAPENIERLSHLADGAAYPAVRPDVVGATEAVLPDDKIVGSFSELVAPILDRMEANKGESRILAQLRDLLLPKLISGELRIKDAARSIGRQA